MTGFWDSAKWDSAKRDSAKWDLAKWSITLSNGYVADDLGSHLTSLNNYSFYILRCLIIGNHKGFTFDVQVESTSHSLRTTNRP